MKDHQPPALFLRFFRWFCHPRLKKYIEGDLIELYHERCEQLGKRRADLQFGIDVLLLFRPGIIKPSRDHNDINSLDMFINYFKTAWRSITGSKFYSGLNLLGLTLGLAVGLLILLWVNDELNYDSFNKNADNIYRVNVHLESAGTRFAVQVVQPTVAYYGLHEVPQIKQAVRLTDCNDYSVFRYQSISLKDNRAVYTDPSLFKIFDYPLIKGNADNPFPIAESVILTQSAAKRFFGEEDPMGKVLLADNKDNFVVSGVVADFPGNSWMKCEMLFSTALVSKQYKERGWDSFDESSWGNYGWVTFLELQPGASIKLVEEHLTRINVTHQPNLKPVDVGFYTLQPLRDIHLYAEDGSPSGMQTVKIFSIVALLILLIASINYVNLSTARAMLRSKEVSVRKIIGASRKQLFFQFIVQTFVFFLIALVFAFAMIALVMPLYNNISGKDMQFDLLSPMVWQVTGVALLFTLVVSSIYPALLLSSFQPVQALKQKLAFGVGNAAFRKVLVVCQFTFSVGLIISTLMIGKQLKYVMEKELGYDKSFVLSMSMNNMQEHYDKVKADLLSQKSITGVTSGTNTIVNVPGATLDVDWDGKNPDGSFFIHTAGIDKDFILLFKIQVIEGVNFSGSQTDSAHFILNETAVRKSGIKDPIGKRFRLGRVNGTITGVVKDFHFESLRQNIQPFVFYYKPVSPRLFVKANRSDAPEAIEAVEKIWRQYNEGFPFDYVFMDDTYGKHYEAEQRISKLFTVFTIVAIVISCLGLLGLATYTAQRRVKEIGIRKILGASVSSITFMLSKDFLVLIVVSIGIAVPVSWILMQRWLQNFAYRTNVQWWIIALAGAGAVLIAFFTISFQSVRAARQNPVNSLKSE